MSSFKDIYLYNNTAGNLTLEQGLVVPTAQYVKLNDYYDVEEVVKSTTIKNAINNETAYLSFNGTTPLNKQQSLRALKNALNLGIIEPIFFVSSVNLRTSGAVLLGTCPAQFSFVVSRILIVLTSAAGLTNTVKIAVGVSSPYTDLVKTTPLIGFKTTNQVWVQKVLGISKVITSGESLYIDVKQAFTGTTALASVYVYGYSTETT